MVLQSFEQGLPVSVLETRENCSEMFVSIWAFVKKKIWVLWMNMKH